MDERGDDPEPQNTTKSKRHQKTDEPPLRRRERLPLARRSIEAAHSSVALRKCASLDAWAAARLRTYNQPPRSQKLTTTITHPIDNSDLGCNRLIPILTAMVTLY